MKRTAIAYLLWLVGLLGLFGLHRFYLGRWVTGLIWLFTGGLFLVGAVIDLFLIPDMVRIENLSRQLLRSAARDAGRGHSPAPMSGNFRAAISR